MNPKEPDLEEQTLVEEYADQGITRALVTTLFPFLSGVDTYLTTLASKRQAARVVRYLKFLREEYSQLDQTKVDKEYFETEEGHDLLLRSLRHATMTRGEDRARIMAKVVAKAAEGTTQVVGPPESIVEALGELTEDETRLLGHLMDRNLNRIYESNLPQDWGFEDMGFLLKRLEARGFLHEIVVNVIPVRREDDEDRQQARSEEVNTQPTYAFTRLTRNLGLLLRGEKIPRRPRSEPISKYF